MDQRWLQSPSQATGQTSITFNLHQWDLSQTACPTLPLGLALQHGSRHTVTHSSAWNSQGKGSLASPTPTLRNSGCLFPSAHLQPMSWPSLRAQPSERWQQSVWFSSSTCLTKGVLSSQHRAGLSLWPLGHGPAFPPVQWGCSSALQKQGTTDPRNLTSCRL